MTAKFLIVLVICFLGLAPSAAAQPVPGKARLNLVFILDGLRPDSINPDDTPNLYKLRLEGVNFLNGHSVFPTVTRVNATAIATGTYPGTNGIVGNTMYVPKVNPNRLRQRRCQNSFQTRRSNGRQYGTREEHG